MITLHELHQRGGDVAKAVNSFGTLHHATTGAGQALAANWKTAERHFLDIQARLMGLPVSPPGGRAQEQERRAENAAIDLLLAIDPDAGHRCPICRRHPPNA